MSIRLPGTARWATLAVLTAALVVPPLGAQSATDLRSAAEIKQLFLDFNAAWERRDPAFIDAYYAHDSTGVFFFERRQLRGWPKVDTLYHNMFASAARGQVRSLYDVLDVGARGNVGWLAANFRLEVIEASGDTTVDEGRQSVVYERRNGRWVAVHRHTSFQAPAGPQRRVPLHVTPGPLWSPTDDTTGGPDAREIRQRRESSNLAITKHDTAGIGAILAPHVIVISSTSAQSQGRAEMLQRFAEQFRARPDVTYRRTPEEVRVFAPWQMASERGSWTGSWTDADGRISIRGSYSAKWRRIGGAWMVESETYVPESCAGGAYCGTAPAAPADASFVRLISSADSSPFAQEGALTAIADMAGPLYAHSMTTLLDGTVLVVGGMGASARASTGAQLFDPRTDRFTDVSGPSVRRFSHAATRLRDGRVLITGGYDAGRDYLDVAEIYDPSTRAFQTVGRMSATRADHQAVLLDDGRVLLTGGTGTGWTFLASAEIFDPRTRAFTATGAMSVARESHVAVKLADGRVLVAGGHRGRRADIVIYRSAELYDPATGRFSPTGDLTIRRHKHDAVALADGRVMVLGGSDERDDRGAYSSTEFYDPARGRFSAGPSMRLSRYKMNGTTLALRDGRLLIGGGATQAEVLDPATGQSTIVGGTARMAGQFSATALLPDGRVLISGGYGGGTGARASAWIYGPSRSASQRSGP